MDLKRLLERGQSEVLGLDVGSSAVKLVELRKANGRYTVTAAGMAGIEGDEDDTKLREKNTVRAIHECLRSSGAQAQMAVCGVCGPEVAVRNFRFPSLAPEEIEGAVLLEAAQVCPFNVDDSAVDYQLIPDGDEGIRGILVAATNGLVKQKSQLIENASLTCVLMDVDGLALMNCLSECEKPEAAGTTAILNIGRSYANLVIMGNDNLPFVRDIAYAGNDIIKHVAEENAVSTEVVKDIFSGRGSSGGAELKIQGSLEGACRKLIVDVTETLRYHAAQEKSAIVEKLFVCGGFSLLKGVIELLDRQLPAKAMVWSPFDKMVCEGGTFCGDVLARSGPALAVAAGLAMRSI